MSTERARQCLRALVRPSWTVRYMRSSAASVSDRGLSSSITRTLTPVPRNDAATSSRPATPRSSSARTGLRARTHVRISRTASRLVRSATATSSQAAAGSE